MELIIRAERPGDWAEAERVTREAFWNCYCPGCCEHYLLHTMRDCSAFVPELSLVALDGEKIVGHVAQIKGEIMGDDGVRRQVLTLGPISVLPEYQRQGVGSRLLAASREAGQGAGLSGNSAAGGPGLLRPPGLPAGGGAGHPDGGRLLCRRAPGLCADRGSTVRGGGPISGGSDL